MRRWAVFALASAPVLFTAGCLGATLLIPPPAPTSVCRAPGAAAAGVQIDLASLPSGSVVGYHGQQLVVAAQIIDAGKALALDLRGQTLGVMTAMGESGLRPLAYGDAVGPDSRGPFQQRANGAWGSLADRMDPTISATDFYRALVKVPGWELLEPTIAAHRVQANADPWYYTPFWGPAQQVVAALAGASPQPATAPWTPASAVPAVAPLTCTTPGLALLDVAAMRWTKPAVGPITSPFGMRTDPVTGVPQLHSGTDIGAPCKAAIYAAAAGRVVQAGPVTGYGDLITLDHGGGVVTRYAHMYNDGILVQVGAAVTAGQVIAQVGANGYATACHLHFEVRLGGQFTDPAPFMAEHGAPLG